MFRCVRILCIVAACLPWATSAADAQLDLTAAKRAVQECVGQVRQEAMRPENYQFGQPPMWRDFDAYVSPDGNVHNNAMYVGEQEGVYRFNKCLAEHGFSLGSAASKNSPKPTATCTQEELDYRPGDCWIKLSIWEKHLAFTGFEYGWIQSYSFAEHQQYDRTGASQTRFLARFDAAKFIAFFDRLYSVPENRTIWWDDAFDLLFRTQTNPKTKYIPELIKLYRNHDKPIYYGYLRRFIPPNKIIISEFNDSFKPQGVSNQTVTLTLLGVSSAGDSKRVSEFMTALLNIKSCNTLIRNTDLYKFLTFKTEEGRKLAKELEKEGFYPELPVVIAYPWGENYQQEEFFDGKGEMSGVVLLKKGESVCYKKMNEFNFVSSVKLGELMLDGAKNQDEYSPNLSQQSAGGNFINLNLYLIANGLRSADHGDDDPRPGAGYLLLPKPDATPDGVKKILTVGAAE